MVTAVPFLAIETDALAPPPLVVMTGASLTLTMVKVIAWVSVCVPSLAWMVTR